MRGAVMANSSIEELLQAANSASGLARNTWITYILFGAYLFVAVGATTPEQLLLEAPISLPLMGVKLPLRVFFQLVPWLFVLMHVYTLVQLYLLSRTLHLLNAALDGSGMIASDRERLRARIDGFAVTQLILGGIRAWLPRQFARLATWITLLFGPVFLLLLFQMQFLAYHDPLTTWSERLALIADLFLVWALWPAIFHPSGRFRDALTQWFRRTAAAVIQVGIQTRAVAESIRPTRWRTHPTSNPASHIRIGQGMARTARTFVHQITPLVALTMSVMAIGFSLMIATIPGEDIETWWIRKQTDLTMQKLPAQCAGFKLGQNVHSTTAQITLVEHEPGALNPVEPTDPAVTSWWSRLTCLLTPAIWTGRTVDETGQLFHRSLGQTWWPTAILFSTTPDFVPGKLHNWPARNIILIDSNLGAADGGQSVKRAIVLRGRDLRNAVMDRTDLSDADLSGADLDGASLRGAKLGLATLDHSFLREALLDRAELSGAKFDYAQLQGASLKGAFLRGASLFHTHMQGAQLDGAQLQGASLNNTELWGASLDAAQMQGADLSDTEMQGATLEGANLEGAELTKTQLSGADLRGACLWRSVAIELSGSSSIEIGDHLPAGNAGECQPHINGKQVSMERAVNVWSAVIPKGEIREKAVQRFESLGRVGPQDDYEPHRLWGALSSDQGKGQENEAMLTRILRILGCQWKYSISSYDAAFSIPDLVVPVVPFTAAGLAIRLSRYKDRTYAAGTAEALLKTGCRGYECRSVACPASEELSPRQKDPLEDVGDTIADQQHRHWPPARPQDSYR
jgi:uncharacterized protein YjbI with pentapeptide repeats